MEGPGIHETPAIDDSIDAVTAIITELNIYPIKSCRGIALERAHVTAAGFEHDREWMIARPDGRHLTQREMPRMALIEPSLDARLLQLHAPGRDPLPVPAELLDNPVTVKCWNDECAAFDAGDDAANWLSSFLEKPVRLVRFNPQHRRLSSMDWTGGVETFQRFSDAFPWMLISQGSLDDLNARLTEALPMHRFRPNIVVDGLAPYDEDRVHEFIAAGVRLQPVKPCARCIITTTNQLTAEREGEEPLRTLRQYRYSAQHKGVLFGQNLMLTTGIGTELRVGQSVGVVWQNA